MQALNAADRAHRQIDRLAVARYRPEAEELRELNDRHRYFRVYQAGRTAPLASGVRLTHAVLGVFPYGLVENAIGRLGDDLAAVRRSYIEATSRLGERLYRGLPNGEELKTRLETLVRHADFADRPLAAAWADLEAPDGVGARTERAATILREHRGNAHVSVLTAHGLTGADALVLDSLWKEREDPEALARSFGWRDDDLEVAWERLREAGRVDGRALTDDGRQERGAIEEVTVALASQPWRALDEAGRTRTVDVLEAAGRALDEQGVPRGLSSAM